MQSIQLTSFPGTGDYAAGPRGRKCPRRGTDRVHGRAPGSGRSLAAVLEAVPSDCATLSPTADAAFVNMYGGGAGFLAMLLPLDGGEGRPLLARDQRPMAWSPDGRQLAFTYSPASPFDLGILNPGDGTTRRVTITPASEEGAEWSADGSTLVFARTTPVNRITTVDFVRLLGRGAPGGPPASEGRAGGRRRLRRARNGGSRRRSYRRARRRAAARRSSPARKRSG
jgi:Tol biopolymer transport system component